MVDHGWPWSKLEAHMPKSETKRAKLITLITRKSGASIDTLKKQLNWQPHTIRAEISRLRQSGLIVTRNATSNGSVYKAQQAAPVSDGGRS